MEIRKTEPVVPDTADENSLPAVPRHEAVVGAVEPSRTALRDTSGTFWSGGSPSDGIEEGRYL